MQLARRAGRKAPVGARRRRACKAKGLAHHRDATSARLARSRSARLYGAAAMAEPEATAETQDSAPPLPCAPCRGTGKLISGAGGTPARGAVPVVRGHGHDDPRPRRAGARRARRRRRRAAARLSERPASARARSSPVDLDYAPITVPRDARGRRRRCPARSASKRTVPLMPGPDGSRTRELDDPRRCPAPGSSRAARSRRRPSAWTTRSDGSVRVTTFGLDAARDRGGDGACVGTVVRGPSSRVRARAAPAAPIARIRPAMQDQEQAARGQVATIVAQRARSDVQCRATRWLAARLVAADEMAWPFVVQIRAARRASR